MTSDQPIAPVNRAAVLAISRPRAALLRLVALGIAVQGVASSLALGLGGKLAMQVSLDWWNFEESAAGFFLHCLAIVGLFTALTHYGLMLAGRARTADGRRMA